MCSSRHHFRSSAPGKSSELLLRCIFSTWCSADYSLHIPHISDDDSSLTLSPSKDMESEAVDKQVPAGAETTKSVKDLPTNQDGHTTSLPSPPSSVKVTELENDRNADGSLSGYAAGDGSLVGAHMGANAGIRRMAALREVQANPETSRCGQ